MRERLELDTTEAEAAIDRLQAKMDLLELTADRILAKVAPSDAGPVIVVNVPSGRKGKLDKGAFQGISRRLHDRDLR